MSFAFHMDLKLSLSWCKNLECTSIKIDVNVTLIKFKKSLKMLVIF